MLTAGGVINAARDRHAAFDRRRTPDGVLLRHLSAYTKQLHGRISSIDPDILRVEQSTAFPLADHEAGITLPDNRFVAAVSIADNSTPANNYPIELIPAITRNDLNAPVLAAWQIGSKIYLRSPASLWTRASSIAISYIAIPVPLTKLSDTLAVPDTAELACIESVALLLARRGHNDPNLPRIVVREFADVFTDAEDQFLKDIANRLGGRRFRTRDIYRPGGMGSGGGERRYSP